MIQCYNYNEGNFTSTIDDLQDKLQDLQKQIVTSRTQNIMASNPNHNILDAIRKEIEKFQIENSFDMRQFHNIDVGGMEIIPNNINNSYLVKIWNIKNIETSVLIVVNDFPSLCNLINDDLKFLITSEISENISNIELTVD